MSKYLHAVRVISHRPLRLTVSLDLVLSLDVVVRGFGRVLVKVVVRGFGRVLVKVVVLGFGRVLVKVVVRGFGRVLVIL